MIKMYCEQCNKRQPFIVEDAHKDVLNEFPWGDIYCKKCRFIIATYSADIEGSYIFTLHKDKAQP